MRSGLPKKVDKAICRLPRAQWEQWRSASVTYPPIPEPCSRKADGTLSPSNASWPRETEKQNKKTKAMYYKDFTQVLREL